MRITVSDDRSAAIAAGFTAMQGRLPVDMTAERWASALGPWDVKAFCDGEKPVGMLMVKGPELHVAVIPEVRGKWLSRRLIREVFAPLLDSYGCAVTKVADCNPRGDDFVSRLGFEKTSGGYVKTLREGFATGAFDPITATTTAIAGSNLIGGIMGSNAAENAARMQQSATEQGIGEQAREYNQSRADLAPYREAGVSAISRIRDLLGLGSGSASSEDIMKMDPGYQFRLDEGMRGITNNARATGMLKSGAALKAAMRYGQGFATNAYDSVFNRLSGLAGTGQTATTTGAGLGAGYAGNVGNLLTAGANARGAAAIGGANALGGAFNTVGNYLGQNAMLSRILGKGGGGGSGGGGYYEPYIGPNYGYEG